MSKLSQDDLNRTLVEIAKERETYYRHTGLLFMALDALETLNVVLKDELCIKYDLED